MMVNDDGDCYARTRSLDGINYVHDQLAALNYRFFWNIMEMHYYLHIVVH